MENKYVMSSVQKRLYAINERVGGNIIYNIPFFIEIDGKLDPVQLEYSIKKIIDRHEVLRTTFSQTTEHFIQKVHEKIDFKLIVEKKQDFCLTEETKKFIKPFDLEKGPLIRAKIITISDVKHILMFDIHHIVFDGESMAIFIDELSNFYMGKELPEIKIQYRKYSAWQNQLDLTKQEEYWLNEFAGETYFGELKTDYVRPMVQSYKGSNVRAELDHVYKAKIKKLSKTTKTTEFMVMMSAFMLLLHKYSSSDTVAVGIPIANRTNLNLYNTIGMFVNTLVIKGEIQGCRTFRDLLVRIQEKSFNAYENQDYQFEKLVEKLSIKLDTSRNPLFDVMFVFQNQDKTEIILGDAVANTLELEQHISKFDMTLSVTDTEDGYTINMEYCTDLFRHTTIEGMVKHYVTLLANILDNPDEKLFRLTMLDEAEEQKIIKEFNDTDASYPKDKTIVDLFEEQVHRTPNKTALLFEGKRLSYEELNCRANSLADRLRTKYHVKPDDLIVLVADRSIEMVVGIYAIMKAGGAYVPIDPSYPEERKKFIINDCKPILILSGSNQRCVETDIPVINLLDETLYSGSKKNLERINKPGDLIYIIYTSGTTGKPKGVMIEHRNVVSLMYNDKFQFDFNENDVWTLFHSYCFDFSVWEIFGSTLYGGELVIVTKETAMDTFAFSELLEKEKVTVLNQVPSSFYNLIDITGNKTISSVRYVVFGGEALNPNKLKIWHSYNPQCKIINMYGITETTVHVTYKEIDSIVIEKEISNIGSAIPASAIYVKSGEELCGIRVPGELCVTGAGVARGYLNRPELTAERFTDNPYGDGKMYHSGDLVRWLEDGNIEYLGRIDQQVKIRGYRIELGEIGSIINELEEIKEAVVIAKEDENREKFLCAYIVADKKINSNDVKNELNSKIPEYMIPSYIIQIEALPLTRNGKLNVKALPEPEFIGENGYLKAGNEEELKVVNAFEMILGIKKVSITDNFFDLGGDSIKAIRIVSKLKEEGYNASIKEVLNQRTPEKIAKVIKKKTTIEKAEVGEVNGIAPLSPVQQEFFRSRLDDPNHFNQSVLLVSQEKIDSQIFEVVLQKLVEHHDILRATYKDGIQVIGKYNEKCWYDFKIFDCDVELINDLSDQLQKSINIESGPIVKAGLFHTPDKDYVLLIIHHLAVDGVSWRIICEDLENGYKQAAAGKGITLPEKTTSFKEWGNKIADYRNSYLLREEIKYWQLKNKEIKKGKFKKDVASSERKPAMEKFELEKQYTDDLLKKCNRAYNSEINHLLIAALARAFNRVTGQKTLSLIMEGHGREEITEGICIDRTVGWFTTMYPVVLKNIGHDVSQVIKNTKENLNRLPNKGIGYGIIKEIGASAFSEISDPDITFNYLGEFGAEQAIGNEIFKMSDMMRGSNIAETNRFGTPISINGGLQHGVLSMGIAYDQSEYNENTIKNLCDLFKHELIGVIEHCKNVETIQYTASDFGEYSWSDKEFIATSDKLEAKGEKIKRIYPLTAMQEGLLYEKLSNEESTQYVTQQAVKFGMLNTENMQAAFDAVVSKHDILHTVIKYKGVNKARQILLMNRKPEFHFLEAASDSEYEKIKEDDVKRGFDLEDNTLIRMTIVKRSDSDYRMILTNHHIILDGWCIAIVYSELYKYYRLLQNEKVIPVENGGRYEDFVRYIENQNKEESLLYWEELLEDYECMADIIPIGVPDRVKEECIRKDISITREMTEKIRQLSVDSGVTVNTITEAAWGILLQRYNHTNDVVFGKVVSGRNAQVKYIDQMLGLFINTIPLRVKTERCDTFKTLIRKIQKQAVESNDHDYCSLADIQSRSRVGSGLVGTLMAFENYYIHNLELDSEEDQLVAEFESVREQTNFGITLSVNIGETLNLGIVYDTQKYGSEEIDLLLGYLQTVLTNAVTQPDTEIKNIQMLSCEEQDLVIKQFNPSEVPYPMDKTVFELFEEQARKTPDKVAVIFKDQKLTYGELIKRADCIAKKLTSEFEVKSDDFIAIISEKSLELMIGIYGILKAGGAYVPLDSSYPKERIEFILGDCCPVAVLKGPGNSDFETKVKQIDLCDNSNYVEVGEPLKYTGKPSDLIYMIYTSGTTGNPKGTMVENSSVVNLLNHLIRTRKFDEKSVILHKTSNVFDVSVWEIFAPLLCGAEVVLLRNGYEKDPEKLAEAIEKYKVTELSFVPSMFKAFISVLDKKDERLKSLSGLQLAGEALSADLVKSYEGYGEIINLYGPTEATVYATEFLCTRNRGEVLIGKPISNVQVYILNENTLCGVGIPGELCITGKGIARGYLNRKELTEEKFIDNPYGEGKLYRSGDLVRWRPDGNIEYMGRIDEQVKIRGFRIEPKEVESRIYGIEGVKEAVIVVNTDNSGSQFLCAYIVGDEEFKTGDIKEKLSKNLPSYMIPASIMQINSIPVTRSGKLDKKALPEPEYQSIQEYVAPSNEIERDIIEIMEYVLGEENIGMNDDFFELGGHSLLAIELINRLNEKLNIKLSFTDFLNALSARDIYNYSRELESGSDEESINWDTIQETAI
jgi:amino acid adenylation domain-containing protein/non-ribosomal peptide synthase protein (TIGR01720 family)